MGKGDRMVQTASFIIVEKRNVQSIMMTFPVPCGSDSRFHCEEKSFGASRPCWFPLNKGSRSYGNINESIRYDHSVIPSHARHELIEHKRLGGAPASDSKKVRAVAWKIRIHL